MESAASITCPEKEEATSKISLTQIAETGKPSEINLESRASNDKFYLVVIDDSTDVRDQAPCCFY